MDWTAVHIIRVLAKRDLEGADLKIIQSRISHQPKAGRGKAYVWPVQSGGNDRTNRSRVPAKEETAPFSAVVLRPFGCAADVMTQVATDLFIEFNGCKSGIVRREICRPVKDAGGLRVVKAVPQLSQREDAKRPAANREEVAGGKDYRTTGRQDYGTARSVVRSRWSVVRGLPLQPSCDSPEAGEGDEKNHHAGRVVPFFQGRQSGG